MSRNIRRYVDMYMPVDFIYVYTHTFIHSIVYMDTYFIRGQSHSLDIFYPA